MSDQPNLDAVDHVIDIQTIMLTRVVDACIGVIRPYMTPNLDGPDPLPTDNPGFYFMVAEVYKNVAAKAQIGSEPAMIREFVAEEARKKETERRPAPPKKEVMA